MNIETKTILASLGFSSVNSQVEIPFPAKKLSLKITRYGNRIFCRGGLPEYDLIKSHLPTSNRRETEILTVGNVPVLCLARETLFSALRSIAHFRILFHGSKRTIKRHQIVSSKLAKQWIAQIPLESELIGESYATIQA